MKRVSISLLKRSLASALAFASLATAANSARAGSLITPMSTSSWSGKSTSVGDFGAGYGASFSVDLTDGALVGSASGDASIELFGTKMSIVDLSASTNINDSSSDGASLAAEIVGVTVFEKSFDDGFTFDASDDVDDYDDLFCVEFFDVSTTFTVVVVPVTMAAGAQGCANLTFSATPQYDTSTHEAILNMNVEPSLDVDLTASVGAGTSSFSVGVEADVTLLDFSLPIVLDPTYNFSSSAFSLDSTGQIDLGMLDGSAKVYAKADLGLWDVKYSKKLFSWDGVSKTWYLWSTGKPSATSLGANISGGTATGSYVYSDTAGTAEGTGSNSSTYVWYRNSVASDTGRVSIDSSKTHTIVEADKDHYLQFCVTPKNGAGTPGDQQCSDWESVGKVASFYWDSNYDGTNLAIAYEKSLSGTCFNLDSYLDDFDNVTSSYKLFAPSDASATFHFFKGYDCDDTASSEYQHRTVSAGGSNEQTSTSDLGSTWNDRLTSVMVTFGETVEAEDVSISFSGNKASSNYDFNVSDSSNTTESGSTYVWYRASSPSGSGSASISGATSKTYTLTPSDDQKFLKVCVTPSNGYTTGSQACSGWRPVGHLLNLYKDQSYGGTSLSFAWEKSERETCFNLTDVSFNDALTSFAWANNSVAASTVWFYEDVDCDGSSMTRTLSAGGSESVSNIGTSWNDKVSSFKVSWSSAVAISTPAITFVGDTANEGHSYSGGGLPESATWTWYRASDSSGTGSTAISGATSRHYTLTGDDHKKYLKACVLSSNGVQVDETTLCSSWMPVGSLLRLFSERDLGGTSVNIAYQSVPSGTCLNLSNMSFDELTSSFDAYAPANGSATFYLYRGADCTGLNPTTHTVPAGSSSQYNFLGITDNTRSSIKVVY